MLKAIIQKYTTSNTRALPYVQCLLTFLTILWFIFGAYTSTHVAISIALYAMIGMFGISIGYHRLLTHRSFKTSKFWEYLCTVIGALAFTGSSIGWVGVHRDHHRYSDKPGDPHSPKNDGYKMLIANYNFTPNKWAVRGLITDKFHLFIHKYYFAILVALAICASVFGVAALMHFVLIPATISIWVSTISNFANHKWGYRNYETTDDSRNLWINAIFTFGEGWHNNHHARPGSFNFGHKWWEIDPAAMVIRLIKK